MAPEPTDATMPQQQPSLSLSDRCRQYVEAQLSGEGQVDGSHDFFHVDRVVQVAEKIAREEGFSEHDIETVRITAALHDIADAKYKGPEEGARLLEEALLHLISHGLDKERAHRVGEMVKRVGFKEELSGGTFKESDLLTYPELGPVQDADKLDAIGAIGIARCFAYSGKIRRPLYDASVPIINFSSKEEYVSSSSSHAPPQKKAKAALAPAYNHFFEKLVHLQGSMRTGSGKAMAASRHQYMLDFLTRFKAEMEGEM